MKINEIHLGMSVADRDTPNDVGVVVLIENGYVQVNYNGCVIAYDRFHVQFLQQIKKVERQAA